MKRAPAGDGFVARWEYTALNEHEQMQFSHPVAHLEYTAMNEHEQMQFFHEMFDASLARLGPGTDAATLRALNTVLAAGSQPKPVTEQAKTAGHPPFGGYPAGRYRRRGTTILDLGCGTGAPTLVLARHLDGEILAIDNHQPYLDALRRRAEVAGVSGKIRTRLLDMRTAAFDEGSFNLIWSEGAIFCMGFCEGLEKCRQWLAPEGFLALTEICWLRPDVPSECRSFLQGLYPPVMDIDGNLSAIKARGYTVVDHFVLPKSAWAEEYNKPLEARLKGLRGRYAGDPERLGMIEFIQAEIDGYRKYSDYYGYVFFIMQR